jgi:hypothetical protein
MDIYSLKGGKLIHIEEVGFKLERDIQKYVTTTSKICLILEQIEPLGASESVKTISQK